MTDLFRANGSGFTIADATGRAIFDSSERMFHVTDTITGTKNFPQRQSGVNTHYDLSTTHVIGSCHALATHLVGAFRITFPGSNNPAGVPGFGWFAAGGSYIHWFDGTSMTSAGLANNPGFMRELGVWVQYTPRVDAGQFLIDEWMRIFGYTSGGLASSYILYEFNMEYRFQAGLFTS